MMKFLPKFFGQKNALFEDLLYFFAQGKQIWNKNHTLLKSKVLDQQKSLNT